MSSAIILVIAFVAIIFIQMLFLISQYKRCPPDKVLVIHGRVSQNPNEKYIVKTSGALFVWPVIQECDYLDASPDDLNIKGNGLSKDNREVSFQSNLIFKISKKDEIAIHAAELFYKKNKSEINSIVLHKIINEIRNEIANHPSEDYQMKTNETQKRFEEIISDTLNSIGMEVVAFKGLDYNLVK